jgi:exonuclease SbcC
VYQRELLNRTGHAQQRERLIARATDLLAEAETTRTSLEAVPAPDESVRAAYHAAEKLSLERERVRDEAAQRLSGAQATESAARSQAAVLVERLGQAHAAARHIEQLQAEREWLEEHFLETVTVVERHVLASLHAEFGELFTSFFSRLVEDETIAVALGESFEPLITQNGYDATIDQLSGGEKTAVALSYRLALFRVVSDFVSTIQTKDLLILDEPTDGFSTEQLHRVRDVLRALGCKQILLVSHEQHMEGACDHVLRITKRLHRSVAQAA